MKAKEIVIQEIESTCSNNYSNYLIGFRTFPESIALLNANNVEVIFGENCKSEKEAKEVVEHFLSKGIQKETKYSLNIAKGVYLIAK